MTLVQWVNEERTVLVRCWADDARDEVDAFPEKLEVAVRPEPGATWGPPVEVTLEP